MYVLYNEPFLRHVPRTYVTCDVTVKGYIGLGKAYPHSVSCVFSLPEQDFFLMLECTYSTLSLCQLIESILKRFNSVYPQ